jgi:signal peptidase I
MKKNFFVLLAVISIIVCYAFIFRPYKVLSNSMVPTLVENDVIVFKQFNFIANLERGNIVMFSVLSNTNVVKRIVGLPGDIITYIDKTLTVTKNCPNQPLLYCPINVAVNGDVTEMSNDPVHRIMYSTFIEEIDGTSYKFQLTSFVPSREKHFFQQEDMPVGKWVVPNDMIFVLGDNRDLSLDSRIYGFVNFDDISSVMVW